jgi:ribokinase
MPRIVVVGSSNTDMTVRVPVLPAAGQTVLGDSFAIMSGGKGANQAVAARRAGAEVVFVAAVGDDELGRQAVERYRREGIDVSHIRTIPSAASGVALIFVGPDGENMIGVAPGANRLLSQGDIDRLPDQVFRGGDVLLVGLEIPVTTAIRAMHRGQAAGMKVILNPAPAPMLAPDLDVALLSAADLITPNRLEVAMLSGMATAESTDPAACARCLLEKGPGSVLVTLGAQGCLVVTGDASQLIAAPRVQAVDAVGAGDAFNGALAVALGRGWPLAEAASWACAAAALAVTKPGAQEALPRRDEIDRLWRQTPVGK